MLTIKIAIEPDAFEFAGEASFSDVRALIDQWFQARPSPDAAALEKLTADIERQNADLATTVTKETPPT